VINIPVVKIDMWEGRNAEQKERLIKSVTDSIAKTLEIPKEHITIIINDVPKTNWGLKGEQASKVR
jgi:4-oxalocrotonate tautomerase